MRRLLLVCAAIAAITWIEFQVFPGHTYLEGDTQLYVPMLQRLDTPGYLSRDLVATHPNLTFTIYDELTLFLHDGGISFKTALQGQQVVCRAAAIIGIFLLARAAGIGNIWALLIAALINLGALLPGPRVSLIPREPLPEGFAFSLCILGAGCLADEKPLLCGLAAGTAFLYDPVIAAVFWIIVIVAFIADRQLRKLIRPALTIFLVFVLLLANLAQLQPGVADFEPLFARIPMDVARIIAGRTPWAWVSLWAGREIWIYLAILVCGLAAITRVWPRLNRASRWIFLLGPLLGVLSLAFSALLIAEFQWWLFPQLQPARWLLYTAEFSMAAAAIAGTQAIHLRRKGEASAWFLFVLVLIIVPRAVAPRVESIPNRAATADLARWAEAETWGGSMFQFPDAGRSLYPGVFRARSRRPLWVDWKSGEQSDYSSVVARTWKERWDREMQGGFSPARLQQSLSLPVDYYVLNKSNRLANIAPVYENSAFVAYDSRDLRAAAKPLRPASSLAQRR